MGIHFLTIFWTFYMGMAVSPQKTTFYKITGVITETSSYCGGAAPSDELIKELETPKPIAFKKMFVKSGNVNKANAKVIKEFTTDSLGQFSLKLPYGQYCLVDEDKVNDAKYKLILTKYAVKTESNEPVDPKCLAKWFAQPDYIFSVSKKSAKKIAHNYHRACNWSGAPCVIYNGPFPP